MRGGKRQALAPTPLTASKGSVPFIPDDDEVLALAVVAQADLIISGDNDLLVLQEFNGIPILSPAQAAAQLGATGKT